MYSALDISEYVFYYYNSHDSFISNLKLQKVLYFLQAEYLVETKEPLFYEPIEAWDFGPVVPIVYKKYAMYGAASIFICHKTSTYKIKATDREIIDRVLDCLKEYTATDLVTITHRQSPWRKAYFENKDISNIELYDYFSNP